MELNLLEVMKNLTAKYVVQLIKAPSRKEYVFGQRIPNKWDVKKEYVQNMKGLMEVASQTGDEEAESYARGTVDSEIKQIEALLKEAKG